jgi:death-on-curing protein
MYYLTRQELLDLHTFVVSHYGGLLGIKSQDQLQTVLNAPYQTMFGAELYPDICSKAAATVYLIIKGHPFVSGNEATALLALLRLLALNDMALRPEIGSGELIWLVRSLNHSDMDREGLEDWLRANVVVAR